MDSSSFSLEMLRKQTDSGVGRPGLGTLWRSAPRLDTLDAMIFDDPNDKTPKSGEGLGKRHPYLWYLAIVGVLFVFLIIMGYLAVSNGWLPDRGI